VAANQSRTLDRCSPVKSMLVDSVPLSVRTSPKASTPLLRGR
jgi:hypothetical protein